MDLGGDGIAGGIVGRQVIAVALERLADPIAVTGLDRDDDVLGGGAAPQRLAQLAINFLIGLLSRRGCCGTCHNQRDDSSGQTLWALHGLGLARNQPRMSRFAINR
jgi:hypothetical protein